jgi:hypothetical protein
VERVPFPPVDQFGLPELAPMELHKIYCVLLDKDAAKERDVRGIDESGEDYLYRPTGLWK